MESLPSEESSLERRGRLATIRKAEGTYSFLYGIHVLTENPRRLPEDTDGIVLESGETRWEKKPLREIAYFRSAPINRQFRKIIPEAEGRAIPLYFFDPVWAHTRRRLLGDLALMGGEAYVGVKLFDGNHPPEHGESDVEKIRYTTREVLGAWCVAPFLSNIGRLVSVLTGIGHHFTAETLKCSHRFHPEQGIFFTTLRNIVMAEKLEWLMRQSECRRHLCTLLGGGHVDIEHFVQNFTSAERLRRLALYRPLVRGVIPATFTDIVECRFDGKDWQEAKRYTVPALQNFLQKVT